MSNKHGVYRSSVPLASRTIEIFDAVHQVVNHRLVSFEHLIDAQNDARQRGAHEVFDQLLACRGTLKAAGAGNAVK